MVFENGNEDVMSEFYSTMVSVPESYWEENIDTNVSTEFAVPRSSDQFLNPSSNVPY